ncbi:MAG: hypothetical protein JW976_01200 [Syntrophaceae bacterium]|nr:hypothetical protein [Syntrophaceae bacterium]
MEKKAEYQISSFINNEGIPEITITGSTKGDNFFKVMNDLETILKEYRAKKAIFDIRSLEGRVEKTEVYRLTRNHHFLIYEVESAMVDLPENASLGDAAINAGLPWEWFTDIDEARKWIKSGQIRSVRQPQLLKKSEYKILSSVKDGILEVVLTGELIKSAVEDLQIKIADIIIEKGINNLLVDDRAMGGSRIGTMETYTTVRRPPPSIPRVKVAVIDRPENAKQGEFLETTAFNAGHVLKFFTDIDAARAWLKGK